MNAYLDVSHDAFTFSTNIQFLVDVYNNHKYLDS